MRFRTRELEDPRPDITPLVDVVFQLIIYFAVSTSFAITGGFKVKLPEASAPRLIDQSERISVVVQAGGEIALDGRPVSETDLESGLKQAAAKNPKALVVIKADRSVSHGLVVTIMDLAQEAGLDRLAIATERKTREAEAEVPP
ncbi:MAG: hypothetical protein A2V67_11920 [Deltaproteobacteria bacterium RBG_13_61_14]|nr:MAG: hypothetical protein A2V67_11920 [Deltaproteobacteria bacterium RBG_13_61_14]